MTEEEIQDSIHKYGQLKSSRFKNYLTPLKRKKMLVYLFLKRNLLQ